MSRKRRKPAPLDRQALEDLARHNCLVTATDDAMVIVDEGPLVLVETRKDLSQLKLPFDQTPS